MTPDARRSSARRAGTAALLAGAWASASAGPAPEPDAAMRAWLRDHPEVRFAPEADHGPYESVGDSGRVEGLSIDVLQVVQRRTGLGVHLLPPRPLEQNLEAVREHRADLLASQPAGAPRAAHLDFSLPYANVPMIVVVRAGTAVASGDPLAALGGYRVAVRADSGMESAVRQRHPKVQWVPVPDDLQALQGVAEGRFDAAVADSASAAWMARRHGLQSLRDAGRVGLDLALSFAVRKDWPQLREIVDIGIRTLTAEERRRLVQHWSPGLAAADRSPPPRPLVQVALVLAGVVLAGVAWALMRPRREHDA